MTPITIEIKNPRIQEKYTQTQLQRLVNNYIENIDDEPDGILYPLEYDTLTPQQQKKVDKIRNTDLKNLQLYDF